MVGKLETLMGEFHSNPSFFFPNYSYSFNSNSNSKLPYEEDPIPNPLLDIPSQTQLPEPNYTFTPTGTTTHDDAVLFSDIALNYINSMLNDEEVLVVDNSSSNLDDLEAAEKPFYDILAQKYPPESNLFSTSDSPDSVNNGGGWGYEFATQSSSFGSSSDGFDPNQFLDMLPAAWQFQRGVEEARKFLPTNDKLVLIDLESNQNQNQFSLSSSSYSEVKQEKEEEESPPSSSSGGSSFGGGRGRKNPYSDDSGLEEEGKRSVKQTAISNSEEGPLQNRDFDDVLLCHGDVIPKAISDIREALQHVVNSKSGGNGGGGGKGRGKKQSKNNKEVVDLRTLLIHCAQMVAADDHRSTSELLKQIRQNSSPIGDGSQRLAHYFANGIEARLAGTGREIYNAFRLKKRTATDFLKAYQLYLVACPFKKISYFFSNQCILNVSERARATRIHVVDFGINFGFQWPSLFQRISARPGGPPMLRITGIDLPQPGFRPAERIEETGRRLAEYAERFNVPFEYKAIASQWEEIRIEDLDIREGELLIVNCLYQLKYLADETVVVDSPRNMVLNLIKRMNPKIFIHGIVNGSYSAPFFVTRFREALFHFSAMFDMLETIVPREDDQRLLIERELFGREAFNVIACEGLERMERPETYKQWQVRNLRAGFVQNPLCRDIVKKARDKVTDFYHKDFCLDDDGRWLMLGWKGRIVLALSSWKPNNAS